MNEWPTDGLTIEDLQFVIDETPNGIYEAKQIFHMIWSDIINVNKFGHDFKRAVLRAREIITPCI